MLKLGKVNRVCVSDIQSGNIIVLDDKHGKITVSTNDRQSLPEIGEPIDIFVYINADDELIASLEEAKIKVGEYKALTVLKCTDYGAFLDWGMPDDLLLPRSEQSTELDVGRKCVVTAVVDDNQRIIASSRLYHYLQEENNSQFKSGDAVGILITQCTELGFKAVIENSHLGMLYHSEVFTDLAVGDSRKAYIKAIRDDDKIDLVLQQAGGALRSQVESDILEFLKNNDGVSHLTDKSRPEDIYKTHGVSKKVYKQALGKLYKSRLITLSKSEIRLAE